MMWKLPFAFLLTFAAQAQTAVRVFEVRVSSRHSQARVGAITFWDHGGARVIPSRVLRAEVSDTTMRYSAEFPRMPRYVALYPESDCCRGSWTVRAQERRAKVDCDEPVLLDFHPMAPYFRYEPKLIPRYSWRK